VVARREAAALLAVRKLTRAACLVAAAPVAPARMAVCKVEQPAAAVPKVVARLVAVECKAAVPQAVVVPRAGPAQRVAAPRVVPAVSRRPGAEPPAVAVPTVLKVVRRAAVRQVVAA
jgi:hypothetical protein